MSDLNQNEPDYDSDGLPSSVRRYAYEGTDHFSRVLAREKKKLLDSIRESSELFILSKASDSTKLEPSTEISEYTIFSIDPITFHMDFIDPNAIPIRGIRTSYNPKTELLIVKMVTQEHSQIAFALHRAVDYSLMRMGLNQAVFDYMGVDINVNGRVKQPDMGWGPRRPPRGCSQRPTVVLEVAVSESESKLRREVTMWVDPARGRANVAIAINVSRKKPMVSIGTWIWDPVNGTSLESQHIEVSESETDEVKLSGGPLIIPFHLFFLRDPETPRETDVIIDKEGLQQIAEWGWDAQFQ
ncbi:hypothetical protein N7462_004017 [Penicillium macrosclerotiorum]|uniref:uncharacterized protein n=1 Tax=Penicillium macrosclerotiorum TaxID=303699 RepID=UPI00254704E8|nr:uncharacterized protein N7462_004017 [Penicillium macrosclerotiorum]KAJ5689625.1 hypothetical protein N7462_004017 [Penicillium macrosclerotiorum]